MKYLETARYAIWDLYQLPPVQAKPVFMFNETETTKGFLMLDLWRKFKLAELTEIMRPKGDGDNQKYYSEC